MVSKYFSGSFKVLSTVCHRLLGRVITSPHYQSLIFFYLNIGIGERYLYSIFFTIVNRIDTMLVILLS